MSGGGFGCFGIMGFRDDAFGVVDACGSALRCGHTAGGGEAFFGARSHPSFVFDQREALVDFVHGHELFLAPTPVSSRESSKVDWVAVFVLTRLSISSIITEAVFNTYDNPGWWVKRLVRGFVRREKLDVPEVGEDDAEAQRDEEK